MAKKKFEDSDEYDSQGEDAELEEPNFSDDEDYVDDISDKGKN